MIALMEFYVQRYGSIQVIDNALMHQLQSCSSGKAHCSYRERLHLRDKSIANVAVPSHGDLM